MAVTVVEPYPQTKEFILKNTIKNKLLAVIFAALLPLTAGAADGLPGATVKPEGKAMSGPSAEEQKARMEQCKANPEKCRAERQSRREQMCKDNPARCKEMKDRQEKRMAECKANPEKCRADKKARFEQMCKDNPARCKEMKENMEKRRAECKTNPEKCRADKKAQFEQRFKRADADGNGMISRAEAAKSLPRLARRFERFDTNKDGQVTVDEIAAARKAKFERRKPRPEAGKI